MTFIISFDKEGHIEQTETEKYSDGAILYYHSDKGEAVTQVALHDDIYMEEA